LRYKETERLKMNGSLFIERADPSSGPYYTLVEENGDGKRDRLAYYGKEKPTFTYPRLYQGLEKGH